MSECILITGGIRSGKSRFALELVKKSGEQVLFIATAEARDEEMKERIERHRKERPASWRTVEATASISEKIKKELPGSDVVLIDCLDMLLSNILNRCASSGNMENINYFEAEKQVDREIMDLEKCIKESKAIFIIVSSEVGMGLVSLNKMGRYFQDLQGKANQRLAEISSEVYFMVSGIPLKTK